MNRLALRALPIGIGLAVVLGAVVVEAGASSLGSALTAFWNGAVGRPYALSDTVAAACPIALIGIAGALVFRSGVLDFGQLGQVVLGGLAAGVVAASTPGPAPFVLVTACLAGAAAGAVWAAAVQGTARSLGGNAVVFSLLANYIAEGLASLLAGHVVRDPGAAGSPVTRPSRAALPILVPQTSLHAGILVAIIAVGLLWWTWRHSHIGHRIRLLGLNPDFCELCGTSRGGMENSIIGVAGALCGLAGAIQVLGVFGRYIDGSLGGPQSVAWIGLMMALLVSRGTIALAFVAFGFAALQTGMYGMQREVGISNGQQLLVIGVLLLAGAFTRQGEQTRRTAL